MPQHDASRRRGRARQGVLVVIGVLHALAIAALLAYRVAVDRGVAAPHLLLVPLHAPRPAPAAVTPRSGAVRAAAPATARRAPVPAPPPVAARPAQASPDWDAAARRAAAAAGVVPEARRGFAMPPAARAPAPQHAFGWSPSATRPTVEIGPGGTVVHLGERCAIVIAPLPFPVCALGKAPPPRGDLFDHLHDAPQPGDWRDPR